MKLFVSNRFLLYNVFMRFCRYIRNKVKKEYTNRSDEQMSDSISQLAENKLIILYLIEKMGIALSNSEICQFSLEKNYMDYFSVQQYLSELVEVGWLDKSRDNNNTRYTLTTDGEEVVNYFIRHISERAKNEINIYVHENRKRIRAEFEVTANYFLELNDDYLVKCSLFDSDGSSLMDINVAVATKEQARLICKNWKRNVNKIYSSILSSLISNEEQPPEPPSVPDTVSKDSQ